MIVAYSCEMCGYSGYTSNWQPYERGEVGCPQCGNHHWHVAEPDAVGYLDDDREAVQSTSFSLHDHSWSSPTG